MRRHPRRAPVDPRNPRAWGTSDRNGMVGTHAKMRFQHEWAGTDIINTRVLVHPDELDVPQRQLGTIILPPDPMPIPNARPENYSIDELYAQITTTYIIPSAGYIVDAEGTGAFSVQLPTTADENGNSVTVNNNGSASISLDAVGTAVINDLQTRSWSTSLSLSAGTSATLLVAGGNWNTWSPVQ